MKKVSDEDCKQIVLGNNLVSTVVAPISTKPAAGSTEEKEVKHTEHAKPTIIKILVRESEDEIVEEDIYCHNIKYDCIQIDQDVNEK